VRKADAPKRRYTFAELVAGVTPENIHPEVDMGPPVGNEML
jgi:antitoxin MazE